jgi:hypothetical protein
MDRVSSLAIGSGLRAARCARWFAELGRPHQAAGESGKNSPHVLGNRQAGKRDKKSFGKMVSSAGGSVLGTAIRSCGLKFSRQVLQLRPRKERPLGSRWTSRTRIAIGSYFRPETKVPLSRTRNYCRRRAWPRALAQAKREFSAERLGSNAAALAVPVWERLLRPVSKTRHRNPDDGPAFVN